MKNRASYCYSSLARFTEGHIDNSKLTTPIPDALAK